MLKLSLINIVKFLVLATVVTIGGSFLRSSSAKNLPVSAENSKVLVADGASVYKKSCVVCHGADGRAQTEKGRETEAVDLTGDDWTPNAARDTRIITRGKGDMPSFKQALNSAQIKSVVAYIRRFKK